MPTLADHREPYRPTWLSGPGPLAFLSRMDPSERTTIFVAVIVAVTIVAAIAMLPNTEEKAQVLLSQGRVSEAIVLYETKRETARLNPFEAYSLAGLYQAQGEIGPLTHLLEDEIATRPQSDWARPMLIGLYRLEGDRTGERATIELGRTNGLASQHDLARLERLKSAATDETAEWRSLALIDNPSAQETPQ